MIRALLSPVTFQRFEFHACRFARKHPFGSKLSSGAVGWAFDINDIAGGHQHAELFALDSSNFGLVGADRKNCRRTGPSKFRDVVGVAIDDTPSNTGSNSGFRNLRHACPNRFYQYGVRFWAGVLNDLDELLGLLDRVIIGVDDLEFDVESGGHLCYGCRLFRLVIVVSSGKSNNYIGFIHLLGARYFSNQRDSVTKIRGLQ